jgi:hypothetical protein
MAGETGTVYAAVAAFTRLSEAELVRGLLSSEGLGAVLADANIVAVDPWVSNAVGGVKVLVPEAERDRAVEILAARGGSPPPDATPQEPWPAFDEESETAGDAVARRAWWSALVGLALLPPILHLYSLALVVSGWRAARGSARARRRLRAALALDFAVLALAALLLARLL